MESLLQKFRPVANGVKRKVIFDITDVTLCKHSETLVSASFPVLPSQNDQKMQEFNRNKPLKALAIAGKQTLAASHAFHAM